MPSTTLEPDPSFKGLDVVGREFEALRKADPLACRDLARLEEEFRVEAAQRSEERNRGRSALRELKERLKWGV